MLQSVPCAGNLETIAVYRLHEKFIDSPVCLSYGHFIHFPFGRSRVISSETLQSDTSAKCLLNLGSDKHACSSETSQSEIFAGSL